MTILITGGIGIGKTTVCRRLADLITRHGLDCGGVLTVKGGQDLFVEDIRTGERKHLAACVRENTGQTFSRYRFDRAGFEFGDRIIDACPSDSVLIVDEIGSLDLENRGFRKVFDILRDRENRINCLAVREKVLDAVEKRLPVANRIFQVTASNRDRIVDDIFSLITSDA